MASRLSAFPQSHPFRSPLVKNPPDAVPSIDELEQLHSELMLANQRVLERRRKARDDLRTIEESIRRMTEKEKGKSKAVDKVKRERDFTPLLDGDDGKGLTSYLPGSTKSRNNTHQPGTSSMRSSVDPRKVVIEEKKKKNKRKREAGDSDLEPESQRPRKSSPAASHVSSIKPSKPVVPLVTAPKVVTGPDFSVPITQNLLPARLPIPSPPRPGPRKPVEVQEDFSNVKAPPQVLVTTFYSSVEPYIRPIKEEDVGFLEYTGDEVEPYVMPKLGRHYLEVWEDQDMGILPPILLEHPTAPSTSYVAPTPKWDPSTLADQDLPIEEKGHGPLTERVISALLPIPDMGVWKGVKAAEDAMEGRPGGSGAAAARKERLNVTDLEARIRDIMRHHGLITKMPDFSERVDDPIATALREAQRELRRVVSINKSRKARLVAIARDRLGYQEYLELRDTIDRNISSLYAKLQKKDAPKLHKKKRKPLQGAAAAAHAAATAAHAAASKGNGNVNVNGNGDEAAAPNFLPPCPAALGLSPDDTNHLTVNEQLKQLVETRRKWVDNVGAIFDEKERERPGRIYGLPTESIYGGIEEEVEEGLRKHWAKEERPPNNSVFTKGPGMRAPAPPVAWKSASSSSPSKPNGVKGKEKARGDAMDIG